MTAAVRLTAITAGVSEPSSSRLLTDRIVRAATRALAARTDAAVEVQVVELRPLAHQITDAMLTGVAGPELDAAIRSVVEADALVAVSPVFTASVSGLFKSFIDVLEDTALVGVPVLLGATAGTPRHSLVVEHAIRPLFAYLRAVTVPTGVFAAAPDWGDAGTALTERIDRAADELATLVTGGSLRPPRSDPFADVVPFAERLRGAGA
ncbi:MAG: CE1759 family FMN reductase [Cellulomonadaceae bacterium]